MIESKSKILSRSIDEDQIAVAKVWAKTFRFNKPEDLATSMMKLLVACVAKGEFKTHSKLSKSDFLQAPSNKLTIIDYLSHAGRIILDYEALSNNNQMQLLSFFPTATENKQVISRIATHAVHRNPQNKIVELKGMMHGVIGQLPSFIKTPRDFGVNIALGGEGQLNSLGNKITANGYSGHIYYNRYDEKLLLMVGIEQSAPITSAFDFFYNEKPQIEGIQYGTDQFGQRHSLVGASDTFTAPGSLYFSDPIYQVKLLLEKGCFPPDKYGGMQVKIDDKNWSEILNFSHKLQKNSRLVDDKKLIDQLLEKPVTAVSSKGEYTSFTHLNFDAYLAQSSQIFIEENDLASTDKMTLANIQSTLKQKIKELQNGELDQYCAFEKVIQQLKSHPVIPTLYVQSLNRIKQLFDLQLKIAPAPCNAPKIVHKQHYVDFGSEIEDKPKEETCPSHSNYLHSNNNECIKNVTISSLSIDPIDSEYQCPEKKAPNFFQGWGSNLIPLATSSTLALPAQAMAFFQKPSHQYRPEPKEVSLPLALFLALASASISIILLYIVYRSVSTNKNSVTLNKPSHAHQ